MHVPHVPEGPRHPGRMYLIPPSPGSNVYIIVLSCSGGGVGGMRGTGRGVRGGGGVLSVFRAGVTSPARAPRPGARRQYLAWIGLWG